MTWEHIALGVQPEDPAAASASMDNAEFAAFYERAARPLWAYLARVSGDPALADDLMQESFVRYLCAPGAVDGEVEARRYLFRIGSNLLKDHWRRPVASALEDVPESAYAAHGLSAQMDGEAMLMPALGKMRPRERQLIWLAYAEGYSHREIAEITGLGATSIRLLLFRARRRLAGMLKDGGAA